MCPYTTCLRRADCWFSHSKADVSLYTAIRTARDRTLGMECPAPRDRTQRKYALEAKESVKHVECKDIKGERRTGTKSCVCLVRVLVDAAWNRRHVPCR